MIPTIGEGGVTMKATTHEEKVELMRDFGEAEINGCWFVLLMQGTQEAQDQFAAAVEELGWVLMVDLCWRKPE